MQRVTAVDKDGNIYSKEDERTGHNELVYELFEEFLEPLQDEEVKGDFIKICTQYATGVVSIVNLN